MQMQSLKRLAFILGFSMIATATSAQSPSTWTSLPPLPEPQVEAGAALLDGRIYIISTTTAWSRWMANYGWWVASKESLETGSPLQICGYLTLP